MRPAGVHMEWEMQRPSKGVGWWQDVQRRLRRVASWKRTDSGIWDSRGKISVFGWLLLLPEVFIRYFRVSRPRHSARRTESVPGMGAQRRSIGGKICLSR